MDKNYLLSLLPPDKDQWIQVHRDQDVKDIIREIIDSHYLNAPLYDRISLHFDGPNIEAITQNIFDFERENIQYREEGQESQTTAVPQGILTRGFGDCKHMASFAGGILDSISRLTGKKINWEYCFASYNILQSVPYHVFVVVHNGANDIWLDNTPGSEDKTPVWEQNIKVKKLPLYRQIAGIGAAVVPSETIADIPEVPAELQGPLSVLIAEGILSPMGEYNQARYKFLNAVSSKQKKQQINQALSAIAAGSNTIGNSFGDAFKAVQHFSAGLGMQVPRASFLGLVRINAFGYANKLEKALQYEDSKAKLADLWERVGGTFSVLENTINAGSTQPVASNVQNSAGTVIYAATPAGTYKDAAGVLRYINTGAPVNAVGGAMIGILPVVAAAVITSAAVIVTAIMPIITKLVHAHNETPPGPALDPVTGLPVGYQSNSITSLFVLVGAALLGYYYYENY